MTAVFWDRSWKLAGISLCVFPGHLITQKKVKHSSFCGLSFWCFETEAGWHFYVQSPRAFDYAKQSKTQFFLWAITLRFRDWSWTKILCVVSLDSMPTEREKYSPLHGPPFCEENSTFDGPPFQEGNAVLFTGHHFVRKTQSFPWATILWGKRGSFYGTPFRAFAAKMGWRLFMCSRRWSARLNRFSHWQQA